MMEIRFAKEIVPGLQFKTWRKGESFPGSLDNVQCIIATDKELEFILNMFIGIPNVLGSNRVAWYGDMAKFIYFNLIHILEEGHRDR